MVKPIPATAIFTPSIVDNCSQQWESVAPVVIRSSMSSICLFFSFSGCCNTNICSLSSKRRHDIFLV